MTRPNSIPILNFTNKPDSYILETPLILLDTGETMLNSERFYNLPSRMERENRRVLSESCQISVSDAESENSTLPCAFTRPSHHSSTYLRSLQEYDLGMSAIIFIPRRDRFISRYTYLNPKFSLFLGCSFHVLCTLPCFPSLLPKNYPSLIFIELLI